MSEPASVPSADPSWRDLATVTLSELAILKTIIIVLSVILFYGAPNQSLLFFFNCINSLKIAHFCSRLRPTPGGTNFEPFYSLPCSLWVDCREWGLSEKLNSWTDYLFARFDLAKPPQDDPCPWARIPDARFLLNCVVK